MAESPHAEVLAVVFATCYIKGFVSNNCGEHACVELARSEQH